MDTLERYAPNENLRRDEAAWRAANISWHFAEVELDLSNATAGAETSFAAVTTLNFTSASPETFIDYIHESIQSIVLNGSEIPVADAVLDARIYLRGLRTDAPNTVRIAGRSSYSRSGEGLHRFVDPQDGQTYLYTQFEPSEARRVFACFEQPDLKTSYRFTLTGPEGWHLASNQQILDEVNNGDGSKTVSCAPTAPISSYITAVLAGPYHVVRGTHLQKLADGEELSIEMAATCRASLAEHFDGEEILKLTSQGLDYFHELFDFPYPWGKYDSAFVPEYNLGAMENPGLVTFTERYVFTSQATEAQHEQRANTLMHEMAHMWFGDLVTMRWWDDLWLKESFADYIGTLANDEATDFTTAWTTFAARRKAWAYVADQMPSTHPIVADIPDLLAADQNFDGITYAKGASVLKQLAAYVGAEAFRDAARAYFREHAYANTTLEDFLQALEKASGRDMRGWADAWLKTSGVPKLAAHYTVDESGLITAAQLEQRGTDPISGEPIIRPHVLSVSAYTLHAGILERSESQRVELLGASVDLDFLVGQRAPDLLLPNDGDETYALIEFDQRSLQTLLEHLGALRDSLPRATCWASLWDAVRQGKLDAQSYVAAILEHAHTIEDSGVFSVLLDQLATSISKYVAPELRAALREQAARVLTGWLTDFASGSDQQTTTARMLARLARSGVAPEIIDSFLAEEPNPYRVTVDEQLRWASYIALAASGRLDSAAQERMHEAAKANPTSVAQNSVRTALAARPDAAVKEAAFDTVLMGHDDNGSLSNDALSAIAQGFAMGSPSLLADCQRRYWAAILPVFETMSMEFATRVIEGLYPGIQDLTGDPEQNPTLLAANAWLEANQSAPAALQRILIEERAELQRSLQAQSFSRISR
ncbi:aminopeptidase N [Arthrobacter sp. MYb224]|uniref:aminopeptidase N n=1 Tax=Arthrobacter sp. MYb224 TaxID=1848600 RepID=UPI000CFCA06A|nr:aminopeptidase N [Arthrobacter sp. MYb224]PRA01038.1 aminopeptidase N [Arthrobacter sp. MYb224]